MRRNGHEREHELVADAIARDSHARLLLRVHLAGEHELACTGDEELAALEVLHDRCHAVSGASGGGRDRAHGG